VIDEKPIILCPRRPRGQDKDESKVWAKAFKNLIHVVRMTSKPSDSSRRRKQGVGTQDRREPRIGNVALCGSRIPGIGYRVSGPRMAVTSSGTVLFTSRAAKVPQASTPLEAFQTCPRSYEDGNLPAIPGCSS
jgi:hypothetical protein